MRTSPFDVVVITSPDAPSARAARELIRSSCGAFPSADPSEEDVSDGSVLQSADGTLFVSSCDPYGARMGSGGGTIAALAEADEAYRQRGKLQLTDVDGAGADPPTVLVCHAGGESSRCPTQIALGKAWTSLPVRQESSSPWMTSTVSNPTAMLISSLSEVFRDVPRGSVVVAASDVLLSFGSDEVSKRTISFENAKDGVLGLAVPAPLATAKNHGVFVLDSQSEGEEWRIQPTHEVLQKPTMPEMIAKENPPCTFIHDDSTQNIGERCAWIDTGVIAFLPAAAGTLRELSQSNLKCCTRKGLAEMHEERFSGQEVKRQKVDLDEASSQSSSAALSIEEFARLEAPKICLYGDMLHALRTATTAAKERPGGRGESSTLVKLREKLSDRRLYTCAIPTGSFVHLGTTAELREFLALGALGDVITGTKVDAKVQRRYQHFGRAIGLTGRADSFVTGVKPEYGHDGHNIVLNSVLDAKNITLGAQCVVEHCRIDCDGDIEIGDGCLISGVRGKLKPGTLCVPNGLCLQLLPLKQTGASLNGAMGTTAFVCLCVGVEESIKETPAKTLFGLDLQHVLQRYGLTKADLWDDDIPPPKRCIWNAKINPVLYDEGDELELDFSFLDWLAVLWQEYNWDGLRSNSSLIVAGKPDGAYPALHPAMKGLKQWKEATRLSLSQIRACVDSEAETNYRSSIQSKHFEDERLADVSAILTKRRHVACNFDYVVDFVSNSSGSCCEVLRTAVETLGNVASQALPNSRHLDVAGRAFMTMAALISDIPLPKENGVGDAGKAFRKSMNDAIAALHAPRIPDDAVSNITSVCKLVIASQDGSYTRATAPARIDLAGGWSDTPPISYEFGGAVACLAVLVEGKRPLRASCRIVKGSSGITLCTETLNLSDETLINSTEVTIRTLGAMADFRNPKAECTLLKCALIYLGLVSVHSIIDGDGSSSIQPFLKAFCQTDEDDVGLHITSQSLLPTGSGMGSSSILAGCIIAAIAKCVGIQLSGMNNHTPGATDINDSTSLIHAVLMVEQLLTTGGGWQDNIGGLVGGLKLGSSEAHALPLQTQVQCYELPPALVEEMNQRLVLTFSGKPRLAKNILQNVLRRWARRSEEIKETVKRLVDGASNAIAAVREGDLDTLGEVMSQYWQLKVAMAGVESGVEPASVRSLLDLLSSEGDIVGGTLCGAGGGGFLALLASKGKTATGIQATVEKALRDGNASGVDDSFSWHSCTVSEEGLIVEVTNEE
ncbi:hypothetical protein ACHAXT_005857 [Thalassiosira profunda]